MKNSIIVAQHDDTAVAPGQTCETVDAQRTTSGALLTPARLVTSAAYRICADYSLHLRQNRAAGADDSAGRISAGRGAYTWSSITSHASISDAGGNYRALVSAVADFTATIAHLYAVAV